MYMYTKCTLPLPLPCRSLSPSTLESLWREQPHLKVCALKLHMTVYFCCIWGMCVLVWKVLPAKCMPCAQLVL